MIQATVLPRSRFKRTPSSTILPVQRQSTLSCYSRCHKTFSYDPVVDFQQKLRRAASDLPNRPFTQSEASDCSTRSVGLRKLLKALGLRWSALAPAAH